MFETLSGKLVGAVRKLRGVSIISESNIQDTLREIRLALLEADVNIQVVKEFLDRVKGRALGVSVAPHLSPAHVIVKIVHEELKGILGEETSDLDLLARPPVVIMTVGLQGAGKTTACAKLAFQLKKKKKKALLVPLDPRRPAAKDQLQALAKKNELLCFDSNLGDPVSDIAAAALVQAKRDDIPVVIFDTSGRLSVDTDLMEELKELETKFQPTERLLVVDAMTGQEAVKVAAQFHEKIPLTGVILTKLDGDARGGAALSIKTRVGIPIKFIGVGEKVSDLEVFHPDRIASRLLDMGDLTGLLEKAQENITENDASQMAHKIQKNRFTLSDFRDQMRAIQKMGSLESILKMLPGMGDLSQKMQGMPSPDEEFKKFESIINSMTLQEREDHTVLNGSRRARIAKGSGTTVTDVNRFIKRFEESQRMMKQMLKMKNAFGNPFKKF